MNIVPIVRWMSKKEFSEMSGIPERTLRNYLNVRYYPELEKIGYSKLQRMLTPKQVSWLQKKLVVVTDE